MKDQLASIQNATTLQGLLGTYGTFAGLQVPEKYIRAVPIGHSIQSGAQLYTTYTVQQSDFAHDSDYARQFAIDQRKELAFPYKPVTPTGPEGSTNFYMYAGNTDFVFELDNGVYTRQALVEQYLGVVRMWSYDTGRFRLISANNGNAVLNLNHPAHISARYWDGVRTDPASNFPLIKDTIVTLGQWYTLSELTVGLVADFNYLHVYWDYNVNL